MLISRLVCRLMTLGRADEAATPCAMRPQTHSPQAAAHNSAARLVPFPAQHAAKPPAPSPGQISPAASPWAARQTEGVSAETQRSCVTNVQSVPPTAPGQRNQFTRIIIQLSTIPSGALSTGKVQRSQQLSPVPATVQPAQLWPAEYCMLEAYQERLELFDPCDTRDRCSAVTGGAHTQQASTRCDGHR
jgi:hypothetical protein